MTELKNKIIALCNQSGLTIEQVVFVLKDAYRDAEDSFLAFKAKQETKKEQLQKQEEVQDNIEQEE